MDPIVLLFTITVALLIVFIINGHSLKRLKHIKSFRENFSGNSYFKLQWNPPTDNGGDPNITYTYNICQGVLSSACTSSDALMTGSTTDTSVNFTLGNWDNEYTISIQATNSAGPGPTTTVNLMTGETNFGGIIISAPGSSNPPALGSNTFEVASAFGSWNYNNTGAPPATIGSNSNIKYTLTRNAQVVDSGTIAAANLGYNPTAPEQINATVTLNGTNTFENGDQLYASIYIADPNNKDAAFIDGTITISASVPGAVAGISWSFVPSS